MIEAEGLQEEREGEEYLIYGHLLWNEESEKERWRKNTGYKGLLAEAIIFIQFDPIHVNKNPKEINYCI